MKFIPSIQNFFKPKIMERKAILVTDMVPSHPNEKEQQCGTMLLLYHETSSSL
jgi:hypothetical protein